MPGLSFESTLKKSREIDMKKLLLAAIIGTTLTGCTTGEILMMDGKRNFRIIQVLDNGNFLTMDCTKATDDGGCYGNVALMLKGSDPMPYNDKIIHLDNPQIVDTFTYINSKEQQRTVPVIIDKPKK